MERAAAKCLLEIKAVYFGFEKEYISETGLDIPIYCDNRLILSYPTVRKTFSKYLAKEVKEHYPDVEMIVGTAVNGISFATLISEQLNLPMGYVLKKVKQHGLKNRIEGLVKPNTKVVIVDDVVLTGQTIIEVNDCLKEVNCNVLGAISIFSYNIKETNDLLKENNINLTSLTNYDVVSLIGMQSGLISYKDYLKTKKFIENPFNNNWRN